MAKKKITDPRRGMDKDALREDIARHLRFTLSKDRFSHTPWDDYRSVVFTLLDRLHDRWIETQQHYYETDQKRVYYISMEYLIGRLLDNMLYNLGLQDVVADALDELELDYDLLREQEWDAGLGNGGLGRLAACFLDSMATLGIPGYGYGIRYDYGIFYQRIENGYQVEYPDLWLRYGNPWDIVRPNTMYPVHFYGHSTSYKDSDGKVRYQWADSKSVLALAYDTPIPGFKNNIVNNLRLWKASSASTFDLKSFNQGDYIDAVRDNELEENISRVLYPNDKVFVGQELRLKQEYFLVSATLQDIIRRFSKKHSDWSKLPEKVAIQCNDTHPNLAIPELMRVLVDDEHLPWDKAWDITVKTMSYTNHTLMPEALEKWPVSLMRHLLPRHLEIIYEINRRFLDKVKADYGNDQQKLKRMSLITSEENPKVKMAELGIVGSKKINGVAELHSSLVKKDLFPEYYEMYPDRFTNKTNGITPRRWLRQCNPGLSELIISKIGEDWVTDLSKINEIEKYVDDKDFRTAFEEVKKKNKKDLADFIADRYDIDINPDSIFDIQIKRIHEYKRQLMAVMYAMVLYNRLKKNPDMDFQPRTFLFAGKAAPGYAIAKMHIKLINSIAEVINNDPVTKDKLRVVFMHNYSVTLAERMIPAANVSEQISTAGKEASGTGNMKFALNGALTIGTLDGANVEIKEEVGDENIFIFGNTVDEVEQLRREGYNPYKYYESYDELREVIDQIKNGDLVPEGEDPNLFQPVIKALLEEGDYFMVLADFESYVKKQDEVEEVYRDREEWIKRAIYNVARVGKFSTDRTIMDYANEIWEVEPIHHIDLEKRTGNKKLL